MQESGARYDCGLGERLYLVDPAEYIEVVFNIPFGGRVAGYYAFVGRMPMVSAHQSLGWAIKQKYFNMIPAKRFGRVDDVADTIAFLLSDKASYINGTNIHINGGLI